MGEVLESGAMGSRLEEIFAAWGDELRARGLVLRFEFDPNLVLESSEAFDAALIELCRLILATVPDGCEIYFGSASSTAPVSRLGAGWWTARWQVVGDGGESSKVTRIRPRRGSAADQLETPQADRVRDLFKQTRWHFSLETVGEADELVARASLR